MKRGDLATSPFITVTFVYLFFFFLKALFKQSAKCAGRSSMFVYDQTIKNRGLAFRDFDETYKKSRSFALKFMKKG